MVVTGSLTVKYFAHREAGIVSSHGLKTQATVCAAASQKCCSLSTNRQGSLSSGSSLAHGLPFSLGQLRFPASASLVLD